jgi:DNA-binding transcriptional LysR family regulator
MLRSDQGLMLANDVMVRYSSRLPNVRRVLAAWNGPDMELNAVFPGGRVLSPKVRVFVDFMAEKMEMQCVFARMGGECPAQAVRKTSAITA